MNIQIEKTFIANNTVGIVYVINGLRCATFLGHVDMIIATRESGQTMEALAAEKIAPQPSREDKIIEAGSLWEKYGKRRVYFNDLANRVFSDLDHYNTGNISYAEIDGEKISNSRAKRIMADLQWGKIWYDIDAREFCSKGIHEDHVDRIVESIEDEIA